MTPEKIDAAIEVVGHLATLAADMSEDQQHAAAIALHLSIVHGYMVEYSVNVSRGCEPYDAMQKTIRGDLPLGGEEPDDN